MLYEVITIGIFRSILSMGALRMLKHTTGLDKGSSKKTVYVKDPVEGFNEYMHYKPFTIPKKLNTVTAKRPNRAHGMSKAASQNTSA